MVGAMFRRFFPLLLAAAALAHDGLELPPPNSEGDAWNAIQLCLVNIDKLVAEQQWSELPVQGALINRGARFLKEKSADAELRALWQEVENTGVFLVRSAVQNDAAKVTRSFAFYRQQIAGLEPRYDAKVVHAAVFACPMCRGIHELDPAKPCEKCGMKLVPRVIPASSLYNTPGEPSVALAATLDRPLAVGRASTAKIKFTRKKDGAPVTHDELLLVHTEKIHLLIVDESLADYHHEHPRPTGVPGEFACTFTPRRPGAYRVFADIVPALSNVQEYATCDLPAVVEKGDAIPDRDATTSSTVEGLRYDLAWETGGAALRAKTPVNATIKLTTADGKPFTQLEPIMGTFAHLVAFHEDRRTVLHIHPYGVEPQTPADRGGPLMVFRFYAPKPGFYRLYAQVQIGGVARFAPFGLNVAP